MDWLKKWLYFKPTKRVYVEPVIEPLVLENEYDDDAEMYFVIGMGEHDG